MDLIGASAENVMQVTFWNRTSGAVWNSLFEYREGLNQTGF